MLKQKSRFTEKRNVDCLDMRKELMTILVFACSLLTIGCAPEINKGLVRSQLDPSLNTQITHLDFVVDPGLDRFGALSEFTAAAETEMTRRGIDGNTLIGARDSTPTQASNDETYVLDECWLFFKDSLKRTLLMDSLERTFTNDGQKTRNSGVYNAVLVRKSDNRELWRCSFQSRLDNLGVAVQKCFQQMENDRILSRVK